MLKTRIIMTLLIEDSHLVKGKKFEKNRVVDTIIPTLKVYDKREVDELVLYDTKARANNTINFDKIKSLSKYVNIPLAYGGGIDAIEDIHNILRSGADKVVLNSCLYTDMNILKKSVLEFGSQCIMVGIDVKKINNVYHCFSESGTYNTGILFDDWVRQVLNFSPGEIILTSIDHDGVMNGYDLELYSKLSDEIRVPIIASGGAGKLNDFTEVLKTNRVNALAAASIFHFTEITPKMIRNKLSQEGFEVRK
jgi:imidazole glycerol-phosphate synthase subunit HisF